jgi:hypothetical protein
MGQASIKGGEYPVAKLFDKEFVFEIPSYQRPYAWEREQAGELFDDLDRALGDKKAEDAAPYFLGSIVVIKTDDRPNAQVVDGQQRLTTLTLLLSALRAEIEQADWKDALTEHLYEPANPIRKTPNRYRLTLRPTDAKFFQEHLQAPVALGHLETVDVGQAPDSQRHLIENAILLRDRVRSLSPERRRELAEYLTQHCFLVVVSTSTLDSAYRIFSVLNDRGLDLSHADILKAAVLGAMPEHLRDEYGTTWEEVEDELGRDDFRDLLSHYRTIRLKKKPVQTILAELRDIVKPQDRPVEFIDEELVPYADAFGIVKNRSYASAADATPINRSLGWLARIDNGDWIPVALAVLRRWRSDAKALGQLVGALDRLASVLMVGRADVNERIDRYGGILAALEAKTPSIPSVIAAMAPTADEGRAALEIIDGDLYNNKKVRQYVLLRLDSALAAAGATYDYDTITVEHVLPQTPAVDSSWLDWWPDEDERSAWTHRIGNLLLLTRRKNSEAQNFEFADKKVRYFSTKGGGASPFVSTTQVLAEDEWTPKVVARRQAKAVGALKKLWAL